MQKTRNTAEADLTSYTYQFSNLLEIAEIVSRPNRFIMNVKIGDEVMKCHCPTTGRIGNISLSGLPCLLSKSTTEGRKTPYTVEAISVDNGKSWVGINQNAANRYVEYFFKNKQLEKIAENGDKILREQKVGVSKLDFKVENAYIEVKTPLMWLQCATSNMSVFSNSRVTLFERFVRHVTELGNCMKNNEKAVMILCFMYDAPQFQIPPMSERNKTIADTVFQAVDSGVRIWQINLSIDQNGINLIKYFDITHIFENLLERFPNPS